MGGNRVKVIEIRKDRVQCDQSALNAWEKIEKRLNISTALKMGKTWLLSFLLYSNRNPIEVLCKE